MSAPLPCAVPLGQTARRLDFAHLPPVVRREVERRIGAPVVDAQSQDGGYTPAVAAVLTDATGARHFVKAASVLAQRSFADAYRAEASTLAGMPVATPVPRLRWSAEVADWFVLSTEHVEARPPRRPWTIEDLQACLTTTTELAASLTPPPAALDLAPAATELADWPGLWDDVRRVDPERPHLDRAAELAASFAEVLGGETVVHTDVRDDNLLLTPDGRALLCDWSWPCVGAAWLDSLFLLIGPRGDGLDVEAVIAGSPLLAAVPSDDVDVVLALATGYFLRSASLPVPTTSPWIRVLQAWQGEVCWQWLCERRSWA